MSKQTWGGSFVVKFQISLEFPVKAVISCVDNTATKNLCISSVKGTKEGLNRSPVTRVGDVVMATELGKKGLSAVGIQKGRREKRWCVSLLEDNVGHSTQKGERFFCLGPVSKECADLRPRIASNADSIAA
ncbi:60S ribosomal protein L23-like [Neovison vison]|uniref:Large ribosomal subunit protein uL14 n=1 Tax=Neovison vison TaxID=452646 RepID=A0A8C7AK21_NEOVI|nr:60S ribosomal protein L23-like [Neogale vison]